MGLLPIGIPFLVGLDLLGYIRVAAVLMVYIVLVKDILVVAWDTAEQHSHFIF